MKNSATSCLTPMAAKTIENSTLFFQQARLPDDLGGNAVVRQAVSGKDRQLLASHQCIHPVDGRQARLDKFARIAPGIGVDRQPIDIAAVR